MDNPENPIVPAKKTVKRKVKKAKRVAAPKTDVAAAGPFAGLTVAACCKACDVDGCVISGKPYCAHPRKGGLQTGDMGNADAVARLHEAQKQLARADAEKRFT